MVYSDLQDEIIEHRFKDDFSVEYLFKSKTDGEERSTWIPGAELVGTEQMKSYVKEFNVKDPRRVQDHPEEDEYKMKNKKGAQKKTKKINNVVEGGAKN